jgi:hypothetical protein
MNALDGLKQPQAVLDSQGTAHHFDQNGVVDNPPYSPINKDGNITGIHTDPSGKKPPIPPPLTFPVSEKPW